jgi:hypothetical protein
MSFQEPGKTVFWPEVIADPELIKRELLSLLLEGENKLAKF